MATPALSKYASAELANGHSNNPWVISLAAGEQPAADELIIVAVCKADEVDELANVTDSAGNTYTKVAVLPNGAVANPCRIEVWVTGSSSGTVTSVTIDFGAGNWSEKYMFASMHSFTGALLYSPQTLYYEDPSAAETRVVDTDTLDGSTQIFATGTASLACAFFYTYHTGGSGAAGHLSSDWTDTTSEDDTRFGYGEHSFDSFYTITGPASPLSIELTNDTYTNDFSNGVMLLLTGEDDLARIEIPATDIPPYAEGANLTGVAGDYVAGMYVDAGSVAGRRLVLIFTSRHTSPVTVTIDINARYRTFNEDLQISHAIPAAVGSVEGKRAIVLESAALRRVTSDTGEIWISSAQSTFALCTCYAYTWTPSAGL